MGYWYKRGGKTYYRRLYRNQPLTDDAVVGVVGVTNPMSVPVHEGFSMEDGRSRVRYRNAVNVLKRTGRHVFFTRQDVQAAIKAKVDEALGAREEPKAARSYIRGAEVNVSPLDVPLPDYVPEVAKVDEALDALREREAARSYIRGAEVNVSPLDKIMVSSGTQVFESVPLGKRLSSAPYEPGIELMDAKKKILDPKYAVFTKLNDPSLEEHKN